MSDNSLIFSIITMFAVAAVSGLIGVFALTRRMTLAADAISHIALPGLGLAIMFKLNPLIGAAAALIFGALLVWALERRTKIATETIIGVVFSASLALGSLLIGTSEELLDALFGSFTAFGLTEAVIGIGLAALIITTLMFLKEKLTLTFLSPELATTSGLNVSKLNLVFLVMFAVTVVLGLKFLGALLMGSLVIVPAATSRNIAKSFDADLLISFLVSVLSVAIGSYAALRYGTEVGPTIIVVAAVLFFLSLFFKRDR